MQRALLRSKVTIPPQTQHLIRRAQLTEALDRGISDSRLVVVTAPAGYGKTTVLSQWAHESNRPVAWLSVGPEDNHLEGFLRYLLTAWEAVQPDIADSPLGVMLGGMLPDTDAALAEFINAVTITKDRIVFVLDDFHLISNPEVHRALTFIIDHGPPSLSVVMAGRDVPPLRLARYRARQELLELHADDLRFQDEECDTFLNDVMKLDLSSDELTPLENRLEGWAAGLQLAALTLQKRGKETNELRISGRHRLIADYLTEDVFAGLDADTQQFLLHTSMLDRLNASLCDAVTMGTTSQDMLESLERRNLFTMPLDDNREWFRYHPLFADFLHERLMRQHPFEVAALHHTAAHWYLRNDAPDSAFTHALAADNLPLVVEILEEHGLVKLLTGQLQTLHEWLTALPEHWFTEEPELGVLRVGWMLYTGQVEAAIRVLDEVELAVQSSGDVNERALGRVTAVRCFIACFSNDVDQAERHAENALKRLPQTDGAFRGGVWGALGDVYRRNGRWSEAYDRYLQALPYSHTSAGYVQSVGAYGGLADLMLRQGRLHQAAGYWRKALEVISDERSWGRYPLPEIGWVHIRLGEILYQWNDLESAWDHVAFGRERAELSGDPRSIIAGRLLATRVLLARGDTETAESLIEQTRTIATDVQFPDWSSQFERCQAELWLAQDKLRTAVDWSDHAIRDNDESTQPEQEPTHLAVACILIVKGDAASRDRALRLLRRQIETTATEGRIGLQIEALALQALAFWAGEDRTNALGALEHAMRLAEPEGYIRNFVDLGMPMARLLQEAESRNVMPAFVHTLLTACGADLLTRHPGAGRMPEPLSEREIEVLRMIAAGLTNREIAESLFISPETVKKHTGSIYGKLGVRGRTEAVAKSRELNLLA